MKKMRKFDVASCTINSYYGQFDFYCFNYGHHEDENVLVLAKDTPNEWPFIRVQSACFTAEIFRSKDCDCHEQLETSLRLINENGGFFIYLLQDGRGAGIYTKVKGLLLNQIEGLDTADAYDKLQVERDPREYSKVIDVLNYFDCKRMLLLTNNPRKVTALVENGFDVKRVPLEIDATDDSYEYLKTKKEKLGHLFRNL